MIFKYAVSRTLVLIFVLIVLLAHEVKNKLLLLFFVLPTMMKLMPELPYEGN